MTGKPIIIEGNVWAITDADGNLYDSVDTDQIYHNQWLAVTDVAEMGKYAFGNLPGWEDFPSKAAPGDVIVTGANFGAGSSRQHAVDCFQALGIRLIIAASFGAIYRRNAINSGMPILTVLGVSAGDVATGENIKANLETGVVENLARGLTLTGEPWSDVQMDIYRAGDLFLYGRRGLQ
ncbi:MAG: 3-isopropylmalate dehydratase [Candidatus Coatesbacteria bacterium]|nr:MAG: 3-isopropylmalate dehydratase [Candidatus Coatesbacteria bacterium]